MSVLRFIPFVLSISNLVLGAPKAINNTLLQVHHKHLLARNSDGKYPWAALGDSFAAGPGAGDPYDEDPVPRDCLRNKGAYPSQLAPNVPFDSDSRTEDLQFLACTGDVAKQMIEEQIPFMEEDQQVVTLSIGGNDIKFSKVLRACILKPEGPAADDCQTTIDEAQAIIDDELDGILRRAYDKIFEKLDSNYRRKVFVQLYPRFFNSETTWCNDQTLGLVPGFQPKLTQELRRKLNRLSDNLRFSMKRTIQRYYEDKSSLPHEQGGWAENRIFYNDEFDDATYPGKRFCEPKKETFDAEDIWFFIPAGNDSPRTQATASSNTTAGQISAAYDASTCRQDPMSESDGVFAWGCSLASYIAAANITADTTMFTPQFLVKAFHPKTAAFTRIYEQTKDMFRRLAYARDQVVDQGIMTCNIEHEDGDLTYYFSRDTALQAIDDFCTANHNAAVNFTQSVSVQAGGIIVGAYKDDPFPTSCPALDPSADDFISLCKDRLGVPLENCKHAIRLPSKMCCCD